MNQEEINMRLQQYRKNQRYKFLNYDRKEHIQLLNERNKNVRSIELRDNFLVLIYQLNWDTREQYVALLKKYTKNKIKTYEFEKSFKELYKSVEKIAKLLESNQTILSPHKKSFDFGLLLGEVLDYFNIYAPDPEESYEIGADEFDAAIKKIYLDMQNLLGEE